MLKKLILVFVAVLILGGCASSGLKKIRPVGDVKPISVEGVARECQYILPYLL
ncbi:MAG TPA: hypothetical protein P5274_00915 [Candidatus Paceibacterota bacterium]|nr:hypothetical protein [Candidatus Paceibacterota bacterium]